MCIFHYTGEAGNILSQILEECICSMRSGEKCELNVQLQTLQDTSSGSLPDVPDECTKVVYSVHLLSFERGKDVWKLSNQERVELAKHHKTLGTDIFKAGDIKAAAVHYSKALKYLIPAKVDDALQESFQKDILALRNVALLNLAACQLKFKQDHYAAQNCSKVLQTEPENIKALYRRGLALTNMSDFDQAKQDLVKARRLEPKNRAIEEQLRTLEVKIQAQRNKYRDAMKSMFGDKPQSL